MILCLHTLPIEQIQNQAPAMESLVLSVNNVTHVDLTISEKDKPETDCSKDLEPYAIFHLQTIMMYITPEDLRQFKKSEVRKRILNKKGKKKGSISILTDSTNISVLKKEKESAKTKMLDMEEKKSLWRKFF